MQFFENRKIAPDPIFQVGAITDEFSPDNLARALDAMSDLGMTFAELRVVNGKNIIDHSDREIDDQGGSWTISGLTVGDTTLTIAQMPAHAHTPANGTEFLTIAAGLGVTPGTGYGSNPATSTVGGGDPHTHSLSSVGTWRPSYYMSGWIQFA